MESNINNKRKRDGDRAASSATISSQGTRVSSNHTERPDPKRHKSDHTGQAGYQPDVKPAIQPGNATSEAAAGGVEPQHVNSVVPYHDRRLSGHLIAYAIKKMIELQGNDRIQWVELEWYGNQLARFRTLKKHNPFPHNDTTFLTTQSITPQQWFLVAMRSKGRKWYADHTRGLDEPSDKIKSFSEDLSANLARETGEKWHGCFRNWPKAPNINDCGVAAIAQAFYYVTKHGAPPQENIDLDLWRRVALCMVLPPAALDKDIVNPDADDDDSHGLKRSDLDDVETGRQIREWTPILRSPEFRNLLDSTKLHRAALAPAASGSLMEAIDTIKGFYNLVDRQMAATAKTFVEIDKTLERYRAEANGMMSAFETMNQNAQAVRHKALNTVSPVAEKLAAAALLMKEPTVGEDLHKFHAKLLVENEDHEKFVNKARLDCWRMEAVQLLLKNYVKTIDDQRCWLRSLIEKLQKGSLTAGGL